MSNEQVHEDSGVGRPTIHIGVDIGGTKIAGGYALSSPGCVGAGPNASGGKAEAKLGADEAQGFPKLVHIERRPTPRSQVMDAVVEVVDALLQHAQRHLSEPSLAYTIGVGAPGVVDPVEGVVRDAGPTMPGWAGTRVAEVLSQRFPHARVAVENDVRVLGFGESLYGAGAGHARVLFVSIGTGVGGAIVESGTLLRSPRCTAGELRMLWACAPDGRAMRIEDLASGPGLAQAYAQDCAARGEEFNGTLYEVMERHRAGDPLAKEVLYAHMVACGEALGGLATAIDPDVLVVGGGVGNLGEVVLAPIRHGFQQGALAPARTIPVLQARMGTSAPIVGAVELGRLQQT